MSAKRSLPLFESLSPKRSQCTLYPLHPEGSRIIIRIPESELSLVDRVIVAGSSLVIVGAFAWVPMLCLWVYRRWQSIPKEDKRRRTVYATIMLACFGLLAIGPHRHPRVGQWLRVRKWKLWDAWTKFMAMEILVDQPPQRMPPRPKSTSSSSLSANHSEKDAEFDFRKDQALFAFVPHGIFPFAFAFGVLPEIGQRAFGLFQPVVATATQLLPFVRDFLGWMDRVDASRQSVDRALSEGRRLGLVPGGIAEMFEGYPKPNTSPDEEYTIVRKGFIRMAVKHGVPVVPVYCFGSSKLLRRLQSSWLERISLLLRVSFCIFYGNWGLPIPFRQRLLYVIGHPISPASSMANGAYLQSQEDQVEEMYSRFCEELRRIFDRHKDAYGWREKTGAEEEDMAAAAIAFLQGNNDGEVAAEQQPAAVNNTMSASAAAASSHLGGLEDDSEEEEDECRVCRGPAEEDNPLYKPCKCSGSIGLTHQDCLRQWLNVQQRGSGDVCELCKTPFKFAPLYAANAPDRLSPLQVVIGVARRAVAQWFPFVVRCCLAASLWLIVAPLLTNYLYQAWMHRPSLIWERLWSWKLLTTDLVSGAVVAACVIVSFLSLMSFADFLRVELQQRGGIGNNNNHANANNNNGRNANAANANEGAEDAQNNNNNNNNNNNAAAAPAVGEGQNRLQRQGPDEPLLQPADAEIDNELFMRAQFGGGSSSELADLDGSSDSSNNNIINEDDSDKNNLKTQQQSEKAKTENSGASEALPAAVVAENNNRNDVNDNNNNNEGNNDDPWLPLHRPGDRDEAVAHQRNNLDGGDDNDDDDEDFIPPAHEDDDENMIEDDLDHDEARELQEEAMRLLRAAAGGDGQQIRNQQQQQRPNNPNNNNNDAGRNNNNNNFLDLDPDDAMEMDINIALDELLGVRGPLRVVVRNLVWLLAFNAVYLGFFTFFPRLVGTALLSAIFGQTLSPTDEPPTIHSLMAPFSTVTSMSSGFKLNNASLYNMSALELEELYNKTFPLRDRIAHASAANASAATAHDFCGNASYCVWFLPRFVKSTLHYLITNETVVFDDETNSTTDEFPVLNLTSSSSLYEIASAVEVESHRLNTTFRLSDLINVTVGYLVFAVSVIFMRSLWTLSKKIHFLRSNRGRTDNNNNLAGIAAEVGVDLDEDFRIVFDEVNRRLGANNNNNNINLNDWADEQAVPLTFAIGLALDALTAVVKVGILLLLKMFLLPIGLGICLDISTLSLFGATLDSRVLYAGRDLFSFTLMHWVAGITFMLLVTVSVLQLREVAHPDLLAQVIRPQEPQPDLLGNLLHESVATHSKRMVLSLIIYAALLMMHIYVPVRLFVGSGLFEKLTFLQFKSSYLLMPEFQVPVELLFFHLCMLGLLEKNKNLIGEIQHNWLKFMCKPLGLVESMIPLAVSEFKLVGSRSVFMDDDQNEVDPFWYDVAKEEGKREILIRSNLATFEPYVSLVANAGETKPNGERVLRFGSDFIRLPLKAQNEKRPLRMRSVLLPTKIGRYRLKRDMFKNNNPAIQIWEEVSGDAIPRPPEGWDDLGAGGADVQGRWAWGREKKSTIERGVAQRTYFIEGERTKEKIFFVTCKLVALGILSWVATSCVLCTLVSGPLAIGRFFYYVFRVPDNWIHDPFAFALGSLVFYPVMRSLLAALFHGERSSADYLKEWSSRVHMPPVNKVRTMIATAFLSFFVAPLFLGYVVDVGLILSRNDFVDDLKPWMNLKLSTLDWISGLILMSAWSYLGYMNFFTRAYWRAPDDDDDGGDEVPADRNNEEQRANEAADVGLPDEADQTLRPLRWQGEDGRIAKFISIWKSVIVNWEWDKVDAKVLIHDIAFDIVTKLAVVLLFPVALWGYFSWRKSVLSSVERCLIVRGSLLFSIWVQFFFFWREEVQEWFEAAHKAARDDRFLIGEILQNYEGGALVSRS